LKKENFIAAVKNAYPELPAENNLEEIANALYKWRFKINSQTEFYSDCVIDNLSKIL
jgi:hypothetical protein